MDIYAIFCVLNECDYLLIKWSQKKVKMRKIGNSEKNAVFRWFFFISDLSMHFICWRNINPLLKNLSCFIRENVTIGRYKTWFLTWNEHVNQNHVEHFFLIQMIPKYLIKSRPWNFSWSYCRTIEISTFYTSFNQWHHSPKIPTALQPRETRMSMLYILL